MIKLTSQELKKFVSKYTKDAIKAGFKPSKSNFYEIQRDFDYDLFSENVHIMRNGKYPEIVYYLLLLSCIFLNRGITYRNANKKNFFEYTLEYVNANEILLNEEFGEFQKEVLDLHEITFDDIGDGYFELFGRVYAIERESFVEYWIYNHFLCEGCIPIGNTFLVDLNFGLSVGIIDSLDASVALTEAFLDYLVFLHEARFYPDTGDFYDPELYE